MLRLLIHLRLKPLYRVSFVIRAGIEPSFSMLQMSNAFVPGAAALELNSTAPSAKGRACSARYPAPGLPQMLLGAVEPFTLTA